MWIDGMECFANSTHRRSSNTMKKKYVDTPYKLLSCATLIIMNSAVDTPCLLLRNACCR